MNNHKPEAHLILIGTMYLLAESIRTEGLLSVENHIENPADSPIFNAVAPFQNDAVFTVMCDVLRMMTTGLLHIPSLQRYLVAAMSTAELTEQQQSQFSVMEAFMLATLEGMTPGMSAEFGRVHISPAALKPSYVELELFLKTLKNRGRTGSIREVNEAILKRFFNGIAKNE